MCGQDSLHNKPLNAQHSRRGRRQGVSVTLLNPRRVPDEGPAEASALIKELIAHDPKQRPSASEVVERLEELQPGFTRHGSQPLSAMSSLPGSLPSVDSRGRPLTWGAGEHRRNASH